MGSAIWETAVGQAVTEFLQRAVAYAPNVAGAIGLVALGWLLAVTLRAVSVRVLTGVLGLLGRYPRLGQALARSRMGPGFAQLASGLIFWLVMTLFVAAAVERLDLPLAAALVSALAAYLPRVLLGLVIVFAALVAGQYARGGVSAAASAAGLPQAALLGATTQVVLLFFGVVTAADLLGIHSTLLTVVVAVSVGALLGGATLAFGLGSGPAVANIISMFYVLKTYRVGQHVRVGDVEGEIVELAQTGVVISVPEGRVLVPGRRFADDVSVLVTGGRS
ncbi:MAG: mechanosensitive ion channel family protein [Acidobacteria bacterium]|nr:mechanosensitive ion channel family protein [Acidobacteriota bacterium]